MESYSEHPSERVNEPGDYAGAPRVAFSAAHHSLGNSMDQELDES
jgi:hypothetical protein